MKDSNAVPAINLLGSFTFLCRGLNMKKSNCVIDKKQIERFVDLTEKAIDGSWKSRLDKATKDSLINYLSGNGTDEDYKNLRAVGIFFEE